MTLTQTLTLSGGNFPLGQLSGRQFQPINEKVLTTCFLVKTIDNSAWFYFSLIRLKRITKLDKKFIFPFRFQAYCKTEGKTYYSLMRLKRIRILWMFQYFFLIRLERTNLHKISSKTFWIQKFFLYKGKNFTNFTGKHLLRRPFFIKSQAWHLHFY